MYILYSCANMESDMQIDLISFLPPSEKNKLASLVGLRSRISKSVKLNTSFGSFSSSFPFSFSFLPSKRVSYSSRSCKCLIIAIDIAVTLVPLRFHTKYYIRSAIIQQALKSSENLSPRFVFWFPQKLQLKKKFNSGKNT